MNVIKVYSPIVVAAFAASPYQIKQLSQKERKILKTAIRQMNVVNNDKIHEKLISNRKINQRISDRGILHVLRSIFKFIGNRLHLRISSNQLTKSLAKIHNKSDARKTTLLESLRKVCLLLNKTEVPQKKEHYKYVIKTLEFFYSNKQAVKKYHDKIIEVLDFELFFEKAFSPQNQTLEDQLALLCNYEALNWDLDNDSDDISDAILDDQVDFFNSDSDVSINAPIYDNAYYIAAAKSPNLADKFFTLCQNFIKKQLAQNFEKKEDKIDLDEDDLNKADFRLLLDSNSFKAFLDEEKTKGSDVYDEIDGTHYIFTIDDTIIEQQIEFLIEMQIIERGERSDDLDLLESSDDDFANLNNQLNGKRPVQNVSNIEQKITIEDPLYSLASPTISDPNYDKKMKDRDIFLAMLQCLKNNLHIDNANRNYILDTIKGFYILGILSFEQILEKIKNKTYNGLIFPTEFNKIPIHLEGLTEGKTFSDRNSKEQEIGLAQQLLPGAASLLIELFTYYKEKNSVDLFFKEAFYRYNLCMDMRFSRLLPLKERYILLADFFIEPSRPKKTNFLEIFNMFKDLQLKKFAKDKNHPSYLDLDHIENNPLFTKDYFNARTLEKFILEELKIQEIPHKCNDGDLDGKEIKKFIKNYIDDSLIDP